MKLGFEFMHGFFLMSLLHDDACFIQNADEYKTINPMAQVPALAIGESVLTQSVNSRVELLSAKF